MWWNRVTQKDIFAYILRIYVKIALGVKIKLIQWNLSKADTLGTNIFVRFRQVSALDRLGLWDFHQ